MKKKAKNSKEKLSYKIRSYTDFSSVLGGNLSFSLTTINEKHRIALVNGIKKIKKCTQDNVVFSSENNELSFVGENLICSTYSSGAIELSGAINEIKFGEGN